MRKTSDQHNSPEQVSEYVATAVGIADAHELSEADREALLPGILSLVASKQLFYEQAAPLASMQLPRIGH